MFNVLLPGQADPVQVEAAWVDVVGGALRLHDETGNVLAEYAADQWRYCSAGPANAVPAG